jgi:hypothetical protein
LTLVKRALNVDAVIKPQRPCKASNLSQVLCNGIGIDLAGLANKYLARFSGKYGFQTRPAYIGDKLQGRDST